jgi:hypothetical protein
MYSMPSPLDELRIPPNCVGKKLFSDGDTQQGVFHAYDAPDGPKMFAPFLPTSAS